MQDESGTEMQDLQPKNVTFAEAEDVSDQAITGAATSSNNASTDSPGSQVYRVYKRRFLGLTQLVLLNVIVSWDVSLEYVQPITVSSDDFLSG